LTNIKSNSWFSIKEYRTNLTDITKKLIEERNEEATKLKGLAAFFKRNYKIQLLSSANLSHNWDLTKLENKNPAVMRSRKVKLYLNLPQKEMFRQWLGTSRFLYNKTIDHINKNPKGLNKLKIRSSFVTNIPEDEEWQSKTPQGIREGAVFEAFDAFDSNMKKFQKTRIPFKLGFRSKKDPSQTMNLPIYSLNKDFRLYPKLLNENSAILVYKEEKEKTIFREKITYHMVPKLDEDGNQIMKNNKPVKVRSEKIKEVRHVLNHEIKVQWCKPDNWYMIIPNEVKVETKQVNTKDKPVTDVKDINVLKDKDVNCSENQRAIISLDPGVRTFLTGYCPDGTIHKFGDGDIKIIRNYMLKTDKLHSIISKLKGHKRLRFKKALAKRFEKMKNMIKDCHRKIVKYLTDNYDIIIIPVFNSKSMCARDQRKLQSSTVRNMMGWAHGKFRTMLISKVLEMKNKRVLFPNEAYTSKTCGRCGNIKSNLGGAKEYKCLCCGLVIDRDVNGSRNMLLKTCKESDAVISGTCSTLEPLLGN